MDLIGKRFGRYVVTGDAARSRFGVARVTCVCDCGHVKTVQLRHLRSGASRSCGCLRSDWTTANKTEHGDARKGHVTSEHRIWRKMLGRCHCPTDKAFARYGGRGIAVCERWRVDYVNFLDDMGRRPSPQHSIERIDNNGPYSADNCKWATRVEQARNKRTSIVLTFNDTTRHLMEWSELTGIPAGEIRKRLYRRWSIERALTQPMRPSPRF